MNKYFIMNWTIELIGKIRKKVKPNYWERSIRIDEGWVNGRLNTNLG
jgi:hypothetical protein